jgi:hypothetical protein
MAGMLRQGAAIPPHTPLYFACYIKRRTEQGALHVAVYTVESGVFHSLTSVEFP